MTYQKKTQKAKASKFPGKTKKTLSNKDSKKVQGGEMTEAERAADFDNAFDFLE